MALSAAERQLELFAFSTPGDATTEEQFEAFFLTWQPRLYTTIRRYGFEPDEVEDVFQSIMRIWIERDGIRQYNPQYAISTYVYSFVKQHVLQYWQQKRRWTNRHGELDQADWDGVGTPEMEYSEPVIDQVLAHLKQHVPVRRTRDMHRLCRDLYKQVSETGLKNQTELALNYGISGAALKLQMDDLREALVREKLVEVDSRGRVTWAI